MEINEILEYQKKDSEAIKLEKKLNNSVFKKQYSQMLAVVKDSKAHSNAVEKEAEELIAVYEELKKRFEENNAMLETLSKKAEEDNEQKDVDANFEKIASVSNNLNILEKKLLTIAEKVNSTLNEFEQTKKRYGVARAKYNDNKQAYEAEENEIKPQLDKIYAELKQLEKTVDPKVILRYKALRQDRIFPVLVPMVDKACGGCRMEISVADQSRIKEKGYIECEHCRRIIILK